MKCIPVLTAWLIMGSSPALAQNATSLSQAIRYIKLANTLREVDKSQESISLLQRAMPAVQDKNLYWEAVTNEILGLSYKDLRDTTMALRHLEQARTQYTKLKYVASGWGVNEIIRDISSKNVYAGIQIGTAGVKVAIFKTRYETDFYEKDIKTVFDIPNSGLTADLSKSLKGGQDALRIGLDSIQRYNVPAERTFIVFSSDLDQELARTPQNRQAFYEQLALVLPNSNLKIDTTLSPTREAQLFTIGAIPRKVWPTTSALNLGNNSTTGGYFDQDASRRNLTHANRAFHEISLPIGINTLIERIEGKRSLNIDAFKREAQRVVKTVADSALAPRLTTPGLKQRRTIGVGGDIALALVSYLHPEKANVTAVPILEEDIVKFKQLVLDDYKALTRPDLNSVANSGVRNQAEKDIDQVQRQLSEKQLIVGALWLDAINKAYNAGSIPKRFVFIRNANISWVTGKFLETINYEYESTIAKGAMYTR